MMLMRYISREIRRRPGRTVLTLAGIVIGVQALVAIPLTIQTTRGAQRELFEGIAGGADLEVVSNGQGGFSPELAVLVEAVAGVKAAVPVVQSVAAVEGISGPIPVVTLGVDFARDDGTRDHVLFDGALPKDDGQLLLEKNFARSLGVGVGETVRLLVPSGVEGLRVAGLLEPRGTAGVNAGAVTILPLETAQRLYRLDGRVNNLHLVLDEGADTERITEELSRRLPAGLVAQVPAERAAQAREATANSERMLAVLSITSLIAGAFVILNSFLMSFGERRRAFAILRSLGGTRGQITRLLLLEALAFGIVGTAVGIPIGIAAAYGISQLISQFAGVVAPALRVSIGPIVAAGLLGPGVAVAATYFPARDAGRRSPLAVLKRQPQEGGAPDDRTRHRLLYLAAGMIVLFALLYWTVLSGRVRGEAFVLLLSANMLVALVCGAIAVRLLLAPLARLAGRLLQSTVGVEARLAVRQLLRHPTRTWLVAGVLIISVMLSIGFGNALLYAVRDAREVMVRIFLKVDFLVFPTPLSGTELLPVEMPEAYADQIAGIEGVRRVGKGTVLSTTAGGHRIRVFARTIGPGEDFGFRVLGGTNEDLSRDLLRGETVIGTALARRTGLGPGDEITIETRVGPRTSKIAALTAVYNAGGMVALVEWELAKRYFDLEGVRYIYVSADPSERLEVEQRLRKFCEEHNLLMHSRAGFVGTVDDLMNGVIASAWMLLALVFVVASLGVTNCLTMNVVEQTRELGVLRAIAMKRGQVIRMIVLQALVIGVISVVPGAVLGVLIGVAATHAHHAVVGLRVPYSLDPALSLGCVGMAMIVAVLASLPAARRAGRMAIIRALRYE